MNSIPFVQFVMPDGHRRDISIQRSREIADKAMSIWQAGLEFHIEALTTGQISMTVTDPKEEVDLFIEICENAPGVVGKAVDKLISDAYEQICRLPLP